MQDSAEREKGKGRVLIIGPVTEKKKEEKRSCVDDRKGKEKVFERKSCSRVCKGRGRENDSSKKGMDNTPGPVFTREVSHSRRGDYFVKKEGGKETEVLVEGDATQCQEGAAGPRDYSEQRE